MQFRFAMMFSTTSLAGAFSGLLAAAIQNMDGMRGLGGWAWIFVLVSSISHIARACANMVRLWQK